MQTERPVAPSDLDTICRHRETLFREAGRQDDAIVAMRATFRDWLGPRLADATYSGFILEDGGESIAGIGLMVIDWPPHPNHPTEARRGYILNVFVEPAHRGQGLARRLMDLAEAEVARRGVSFLVLHATPMGRPAYEKWGWSAGPEMAKRGRARG